MNEAPATSSPAPVAAPAAVSAPTGAPEPAQAQPPVPEIPADLVAAAAARDAKLQRFAPKSSSQATEAATETAPAAETPASEPGQAAETTEAKPADAEAPKDSVADRIAAYLQQERRLKQQQTKLAADRAAVEAERAQIEAAKAQRQKEADLRAMAEKDPVAAVKALLGDKIKGDFFVDLINRVAAEENGETAETDQQREERIAKQAEERAIARIKAEREAEAKKQAEEKAKADAEIAKKNAAGKEAFFLGLHEQLKADIDKYPYIAANDGIAPAEVDKWMQQQFVQTGKIPSHTEIFKHFDSQYAAAAERHLRSYLRINGGKLPADAAPAPPAAKTPVSAVAPIARPDTRGATTTPAAPAKGRNYKQDVDEMARKLDEMDRARSSQVRG